MSRQYVSFCTRTLVGEGGHTASLSTHDILHLHRLYHCDFVPLLHLPSASKHTVSNANNTIVSIHQDATSDSVCTRFVNVEHVRTHQLQSLVLNSSFG